jgi:hypothetical protein
MIRKVTHLLCDNTVAVVQSIGEVCGVIAGRYYIGCISHSECT